MQTNIKNKLNRIDNKFQSVINEYHNFLSLFKKLV